MEKKEIVIIGAGPTGLGAAWRLRELGFEDFILIDTSTQAGGLATSFRDEQGFTWDLGGHVQFSHYEIFDEYMDLALGKDGWFHHERESWVWMRNRFIPYPFQYNLHCLPNEEKWSCVQGLLKASLDGKWQPQNFKEWILRTFGEGVAETFLFPYNSKVWAFPLERMGYKWVGERVAVPKMEKVLQGICLEQDQVSWGPNHKFRFPKHGGTGAIWKSLAAKLPQEQLIWGDSTVSINGGEKTIRLASGRSFKYEHLISSMPIDKLSQCLNQDDLIQRTSGLLFSGVHVIGVGLEGKTPEHLRTKCWMYFPEADNPFYRVTVFSNYSPFNTPAPGETWSLMAEVSQSPFKRVDSDEIVEKTLEGMRNTGLIRSTDQVLSKWHKFLDHGYPTPSVNRDEMLDYTLSCLEEIEIYSRGRFGAWKYEVSNQDHSFMQGWECANRLCLGLGKEAEPTLYQAATINDQYNKRADAISGTNNGNVGASDTKESRQAKWTR
ncbi:MAG: NAD(P)-binding protein [Candidatus Omnitrophica bacterium]|nr:NAD(P)-binding protein [Candidatus Omnitrophota bacterium]